MICVLFSRTPFPSSCFRLQLAKSYDSLASVLHHANYYLCTPTLGKSLAYVLPIHFKEMLHRSYKLAVNWFLRKFADASNGADLIEKAVRLAKHIGTSPTGECLCEFNLKSGSPSNLVIKLACLILSDILS